MTKTNVIWTTDERLALCKAVASKWLELGFTTVEENHFRQVIDLAQTVDQAWRRRLLTSRDARYFIIRHCETLQKLMVVEQPAQDPVKVQMQEEINRLRAQVEALQAQLAEKDRPQQPPSDIKPIAVKHKPYVPCASPSLPPKTRVAIAGVHDKHRDGIARAFPNLNIAWIEPRDNDALIKAKASGRPAIACTHGTNGKVLKLMHNISSKFFQVNGAHGVRETLASAAFR